jgi:hypothetical protein
MREAESFDAFYARTVASVTSRIHEMAGGDPQADHAIREAYARAYQQWYEVSGYRDTEGWVLDAAREAFERRRAEIVPAPEPSRDSGSWPGQMNSGSWPGWFRPREPADLAAAVAAPHLGGEPAPAQSATGEGPEAGPDRPGDAQPGGLLAGMLTRGPARGPATEPAGPQWPPARGPATEPAGPGPVPPGRGSSGAGGYRPNLAGLRGGTRTLIIACVVAAVVAAGVVYFALGNSNGSGNSHATGPGTGRQIKRPTKPAVQMLKAGHVGTRADIPWTLVGQGWSLAEVSGSTPGVSGTGAGSGATYLVDPEGGRYLVRKWSGDTGQSLLAWSGNSQAALFSSGTGYFVLTLATGQVTTLSLPANVAVAGFTRPDGLALLAVKQGPARLQLVRYDLQGNFQAALASMPRSPSVPSWSNCGAGCAAISSPEGLQAVWGAIGSEMLLINNTGGIERRLHVPGSGHPPHCTPISWWDATTVLASCSAGGTQSTATQLWLIPKDGSPGQALTTASGAASGTGFDTGAWQAAGQQYVTQTTGTQCPTAPSGPGGLQILRLSSSGSPVPVTVTSSTNNHNAVVGADGDKLLVVAQMSCPGSNALLWLNPSTGATQVLIPASATQTGVVAAIPWGSGTATAGN